MMSDALLPIVQQDDAYGDLGGPGLKHFPAGLCRARQLIRNRMAKLNCLATLMDRSREYSMASSRPQFDNVPFPGHPFAGPAGALYLINQMASWLGNSTKNKISLGK